MSYQKDLHVAIVGGGICGLACAVYLGSAGIKVDLFESATYLREIGAGIGLGPNALRVLDEMGISATVIAHADEKSPNQRAFRFVSALPGHEHILDYESLPEDISLPMHRAVFLDALVELIDPTIAHFNKRCTSVSRNGSKQVIHFKDGTKFEADIVIGADGIKSAVRQAVTGDTGGNTRVVFTRTVVYRALLPWADIERAGFTMDFAEWSHCIVGVNKHIITFPIKNGKILNVVVFSTDRSIPEGSVEIPVDKWVVPVEEQEILDVFQDCGTEVQRLLSLIRNPSKWSLHVVSPLLSSFVKGHVALVGDAAHAMRPHLGAGAGQALEDAFVLCKLLVHPETTLVNLEEVLRAYDRVRRPRANMVAERSALAGRYYESLRNGDNSGIIPTLRVQLSEQWTFVHHHDLGADLESAIEGLRNDGIFTAT
ncbi:hypothetical protein JVU11DRAFT_4944 [Chiua virens]|nr:hypothetical protein JVU11DRAFT_4944 [Chiua virens]